MKTKLSTEDIVELIVNETDIRGIDLTFYKKDFQCVADKILKLIDGQEVSYYNTETNTTINLKNDDN